MLRVQIAVISACVVGLSGTFDVLLAFADAFEL